MSSLTAAAVIARLRHLAIGAVAGALAIAVAAALFERRLLRRG